MVLDKNYELSLMWTYTKLNFIIFKVVSIHSFYNFLRLTEVSSSSEKDQATSVTGARIIINPWVWYSRIILPMKNNRSRFKSMWNFRLHIWVSWLAEAPLTTSLGTSLAFCECWLVEFKVHKQRSNREIPTEKMNKRR